MCHLCCETGCGALNGARGGARLASHHFMPVNVVRDSGFGGEGTGLVYGDIDILPAARDRAVDQGGHDGDVGVVTAHVPGITTTRGDGRGTRRVHLVIAAGGHLAARRHVQQVRGQVVPPGAGLAEGVNAHMISPGFCSLRCS